MRARKGIARLAVTSMMGAGIALTGSTGAFAASDPTVRAFPGQDLSDGQEVTVFGSGFQKGSLIYVMECLSGQPTDHQLCNLNGASEFRQLTPDTDGNLLTSFHVRKTFRGWNPAGIPTGETVDCSVDQLPGNGQAPCSVDAFEFSQGGKLRHVSSVIRFKRS